jgi:hypothetical protein
MATTELSTAELAVSRHVTVRLARSTLSISMHATDRGGVASRCEARVGSQRRTYEAIT